MKPPSQIIRDILGQTLDVHALRTLCLSNLVLSTIFQPGVVPEQIDEAANLLGNRRTIVEHLCFALIARGLTGDAICLKTAFELAESVDTALYPD